MRPCDQRDCDAPAVGRYDWPGQAEPVYGCIPHLLKARAIAEALGMTLRIAPTMTGQEEDGPTRFQLLEFDE